MNRRRKKALFENVTIIDLGAKGKAVGKADDGRIIFAPFLSPGDVADIQTFKKRKAYYEGKAIHIKKFSKLRTSPKCKYFGICGGCKLQHISYSEQVKFKQKEVENNLIRLGDMELPEQVSPILKSPEIYNYRNKMEFSFSARRWLTEGEIKQDAIIKNREGLGFHIAGMWDKVLDIDECHLQKDPSNQIRNQIKEFALANDISFYDPREKTGLLRTLMIRNTSIGEWMIVLQIYRNEQDNIKKLMEFIKTSFPQITSLQYIINEKDNDSIYDQEVILYHGRSYIEEKMEDLTFRISAKSFFQTNSQQSLEMYRIIRNFADIQPDNIVYDLYTGTGSIAQFISKNAKKIIGIESVEDAVDDARKNAQRNGIKNIDFIVGDMKEIFTPDFIKKYGKADIVITDPPRSGMHQKVVENLLKLEAEKIIYVSCNSATQARDLGLMKHLYKIEKMQPVDMFPHTHHVENIVLLSKKKS